ncbi:MAG: APC family permease [Anaerolineae bacterium]|nr:APC family permease [Anaerolineae bacterium]
MDREKYHSALSKLLIGRPLETQALSHQSVSRLIGLAVFASDALSSTAYATEEILIILALAGTGSAVLGLSLPIAIAIAVLIVIVTVSYRQTIYTYPNGGGAYIVARDNLGEIPAQVAGAALLTDYILTVAVSITAGVAQVTSAFPALIPYRVPLAIGIILIMMMINLRGVKESGTIFAIPTYFFLVMMFLTLIIGAARYATGTLPVVTGVEAIEGVAAPLTLFLILRAFSSGCTALTGIEAISNGITAFKEPRSRNAASTLVWMSSILILLFLGITLLSHQIQAVPSEFETVISQLARTVYGRGSVPYLLAIAGTMLILIMAANTSFADFPRLAALAAGDGFLPRQLTYRGNRLVLSWGIVGLAVFASILVFITGAQTTALIPLYAIGVFLSFTISQTGMVVHLWRLRNLKPGEQIQGYETTLEYDPAWRFKMILSAVGAFCTFVVMIIFGVTKFASGAWFVIILIPTLVLIFFRIHLHYKQVARSLSTSTTLEAATLRSITTLVLVDDVHAGTLRVLNFARSMGHPWQAVHIAINPEKAERTQAKWKAMVGEPELVVIPSPYRHLAAPLREYVEELLAENPENFVHIVMGHLAMDSFWEQVLHQNSAFVFNVALTGLDRVVFTQIPYQIRDGELINVARRRPPADAV